VNVIDPCIYNIVFIFSLTYQGTNGIYNHVTLPILEDLVTSISTEAKEIERTGMDVMNIDQLCAIGNNNISNKTFKIGFQCSRTLEFFSNYRV
jgi:hypothetical protein